MPDSPPALQPSAPIEIALAVTSPGRPSRELLAAAQQQAAETIDFSTPLRNHENLLAPDAEGPLAQPPSAHAATLAPPEGDDLSALPGAFGDILGLEQDLEDGRRPTVTAPIGLEDTAVGLAAAPDEPFAGNEVESEFAPLGGLSADGTFHDPQGTPAVAPKSHLAGLEPFSKAQSLSLQTETNEPKAAAAPKQTAPASATSDTGQARFSPPQRGYWLAQVASVVLLLPIFVLLALKIVAGDRLPLHWRSLHPTAIKMAFKPTPLPSWNDVHLLWMRSVLYPGKDGTRLLVFTGEVENRGHEARPWLSIQASLKTTTGSIVASAEAPLSAQVTTVNVLRTLVNDDAGAAHWAPAYKSAEPLAADERRQFAVVLVNPPPGLEALRHTVRVLQRQPPPVAAGPSLAEIEAEAKAELEASNQLDAAKGQAQKGKRRKGKKKGKRRGNILAY